MKFIIDTNIVFSAILNTQGKIGDLIMNSNDLFEFYSCGKLLEELKRHHDKMLHLSALTEVQLGQSSLQIINCITLIDETLIPFETWSKAASLMRDTDMDDIAFVALAEFIECKLWTGDKTLMRGLAKKGYSNFIETQELYNLRSMLE